MDSLRWVDTLGTGEVYSYCGVYRPQNRVFDSEVPIYFAAIELDEGPMMLSEIRDAPPGGPHIGMRVRVTFVRLDGDVFIAVWVPE